MARKRGTIFLHKREHIQLKGKTSKEQKESLSNCFKGFSIESQLKDIEDIATKIVNTDGYGDILIKNPLPELDRINNLPDRIKRARAALWHVCGVRKHIENNDIENAVFNALAAAREITYAEVLPLMGAGYQKIVGEVRGGRKTGEATKAATRARNNKICNIAVQNHAEGVEFPFIVRRLSETNRLSKDAIRKILRKRGITKRALKEKK